MLQGFWIDGLTLCSNPKLHSKLYILYVFVCRGTIPWHIQGRGGGSVLQGPLNIYNSGGDTVCRIQRRVRCAKSSIPTHLYKWKIKNRFVTYCGFCGITWRKWMSSSVCESFSSSDSLFFNCRISRSSFSTNPLARIIAVFSWSPTSSFTSEHFLLTESISSLNILSLSFAAVCAEHCEKGREAPWSGYVTGFTQGLCVPHWLTEQLTKLKCSPSVPTHCEWLQSLSQFQQLFASQLDPLLNCLLCCPELSLYRGCTRHL